MSSIRVFGHYVCPKFVLLAVTEFVISAGAIYLAAFIHFHGDIDAIETNIGLLGLGILAFIFSLVMVLNIEAMGLYEPWQRMTILQTLLRIAISFLIGFLMVICLSYLFPNLFLGQGILIPALVLSFTGIGFARVMFYSPIGENYFRRRVMVVGAGKRASPFMRLRRRADQRTFYILGFVKCEGERSVVDPSRILVVNTSLLDFAKKHKVDEIVVALEDQRREYLLSELLDCRMSGIDVTDVSTFLERETRKIKLDVLQPSWIIFSNGFRQKCPCLVIKRIFDVTFCMLLLLMTWPIMVVTALAILIENNGKGPVLYRQNRVGQEGEIFEILKFRSMCLNAEQDGKARWARMNDPRVTRVGAWIRKSRIDELPQLFNILRGDMSLIGPRPERPEFVKGLTEKIPYYGDRHRVKPGLTGWAQLCYSYGASQKDALEKLQYDLYYVKNHSFFLDLMILIQTFEVVLFGRGAR